MAYRPDRRLVSLEEARGILAVHGEPVGRVERVPLDDAADRVLARDVVSDGDVPPFSRALMDGYAVRAADTAGASPDRPIVLTVKGSVHAGSALDVPVGPASCTAIATGAPVPSGADAIAIVERTERTGDSVSVLEAARAGQHIGPAGSDLTAGEVALREGTVLTPARLAVLSALGETEVEVFARPRVAILSTGDEIVAPGQPLETGQIYDANTTGLRAAVRAHGGTPLVAPRTKDDREALRRAFESCLTSDLVLFSGGTSVGERDFILEIIAALGHVHFEGLKLKPGKPTVFAIVRGVPVFGMPGNPVSCLTNMYLLVAPLLRRLAHLPPHLERRLVVRLRSAVTSPADRHQIYPVRIEGGEAVPVFKGSGEITSLAHADGYFEIPAGIDSVPAGTAVEVVLF